MNITIRIKGNQIRTIYNDELVSCLKRLGITKTKRATNVEPDDNGNWKIDLSPVNGPIIDSFESRQKALNTEVEWLLYNHIPVPK